MSESTAFTLPWHARGKAVERLAEDGGRFGDRVALVVPLLLPVEFTVRGQLFLPEVVLLVALPFLLDAARRRGVSRISHSVVVLGGLWLFGLILTDVYRGTSSHDYFRGWANVAFLLIDFAGLSLLIDGRWRRVALFAAGLVGGEVLQFYFNPDVFAATYPWKFGYGGAVTLAGVLLASRPAVYCRPVVATGILIALGVVNLKMGFRSLGGVCLLAAFMVMLAARSTHMVRLDRRALRTLATLVASVFVGLIVVGGYGYAARHGMLGARAQQKYSAQQGNLGVVVGGRAEILASMRAIRDSPIVGHGSWAKDPKYSAALRDELARLGYPTYESAPSSGLIPTHSYLFGAWVYGGILGALLWLWALGLVGSLFPYLRRLRDGRIVLVAFLGLAFVWDVLFSPFGAQGRLTSAFSLTVFLLARKDIRAKSEA